MNLGREKAIGKSTDGAADSPRAESSSIASSGWCRMDTYDAADSDTMSLTRRSSSSAPFLTEASESAAS